MVSSLLSLLPGICQQYQSFVCTAVKSVTLNIIQNWTEVLSVTAEFLGWSTSFLIFIILHVVLSSASWAFNSNISLSLFSTYLQLSVDLPVGRVPSPAAVLVYSVGITSYHIVFKLSYRVSPNPWDYGLKSTDNQKKRFKVTSRRLEIRQLKWCP